MTSNCYDFPKYYEIAFDFRNIAQEVDVFEKLIKKYAECPVNDFIELACGPSQHMIEISKRGYHFTGLDINQSMLEYCREKALNASVQAEFINGSMVNFTLSKKVDFAFIALGSLYLSSSSEMNAHFDSVSQALNIGGLFLLDWCVQFDPVTLFNEKGQTWEVSKDDINVSASVKMKPINFLEQLFEEQLEMIVRDGNRQETLKSYSIKRAIYPQEFLNFMKHRSDFEFIGWWNNWDLSQPLSGGSLSIFRPIVLLRRI